MYYQETSSTSLSQFLGQDNGVVPAAKQLHRPGWNIFYTTPSWIFKENGFESRNRTVLCHVCQTPSSIICNYGGCKYDRERYQVGDLKILVAIKRVADANIRVRVRTDGKRVDLENVKMVINPFDEIAVEEAVRLKEAGSASEVVILSIGNRLCEETVRAALALDADRGIHVLSDDELEPLSIAKLIQKIVEIEQPDLVFLGKQAIDDDNNQVGQMLAALLDWPQATFASEVRLREDELLVTREIDSGLETLALELPAVVTADLRLNDPRYAKLTSIMKAKKKTITVYAADDLEVNTSPRLEVIRIEEPAPRKACVMVADTNELIDRLKNEVKVLP